MNSEIQIRLLRAVYGCLRPLARMLLRSGITYRQFADISKIAFVREALEDRDSRGRVANVSRVAVRTALSRKEVSRLVESRPDISQETISHLAGSTGPAARVLQLWHIDSRFTNAEGLPRELGLEGASGSFSELVKLVAGDVPPGAVRAELIRSQSIEDLGDGRLRVLKRYYVPADINEEMLTGLLHVLLPVVEGIAHNSDPKRVGPTYIQRFAYSDRLVPEALPRFRQLARTRASDFVGSIDDWLGSNEIPPSEPMSENRRVGIGVYYFEGALKLDENDMESPSGEAIDPDQLGSAAE